MTPGPFHFTVTHREGLARRGELRTPHGVVQTPAFMPVGTRGAVKAVTHRELEALGAEIILGNTYHLFLRPGADLIARCGGLHAFIGWPHPILTDSGGYQVFSLATSEDSGRGAEFVASRWREASLTPKLRPCAGAARSDIAWCSTRIATPATPAAARDAMERSVRWARRARTRFEQLRIDPGAVQVTNPGQAQFGIVQGATFADLRTESVQATVEIGFEAYAIGGLSVGEPPEIMYDVVGHTAPLLPEDRPRYLMGTGMPDDLFECVARHRPVRLSPDDPERANGQFMTSRGPLSRKNARSPRTRAPPIGLRLTTPPYVSRAYLRPYGLVKYRSHPQLTA